MSEIYVNAALGDRAAGRLRAALAGRKIHWAAATGVLGAGKSDPELGEAVVAFGQPDVDALQNGLQLRLVQLSSAGWTRYDRDDLRATLGKRGIALCTASSVYADAVAEHAVAMILALLRRLPESLLEQHTERRWRFEELRAVSRTLAGESVLLLGYGTIARSMAARLLPFGANLVGYRRRVRGDETIPMIDATGLAEALADADHVVDLLPESAETARFVNAQLLARMKRGARFYNVGRGATVDQPALVDALRQGALDAAWLDVTTPEPLPPEHPLWTIPRLFISPHTAGGQADESMRLVEHFVDNLARFESGRPLVDRVI